MALFSSDALNPGVQKREVFGWAMYDFANSGYTTVVLTAVFAAYFVGAVAGGASWATFAWTASLAASNALVMLSIPVLGAWADQHGAKKRLLMLSTLGCVLFTAGLGFVKPGALAMAGPASSEELKLLQHSGFPWESNHLYFTVREPFPSRSSQAELVFGRIERGTSLQLTSAMPDYGVIFSDGVESDFLEFNSGIRADVGISPRSGTLVL